MAKILNPTTHDIGGLYVKRVLPHFDKKMVGPFIFFDRIEPNDFPIGQGVNVRPHPHIGLSTLTYLLHGSILHRDSLGNNLEIHAGDVNWMTAGKGIVHSERESFEVRASPHHIDGLQCWVALPEDMTEIEPSFCHVKKQQLPYIIHDGIMMKLVIGEAYGLSSPVNTYSPMFYVDVVGSANSQIKSPNPQQETALYIIYGSVTVGQQDYQAGDFILFDSQDTEIHFATDARFILLGGDKFTKTPYLHWNFAAYSKERLEQAKQDWQAQRFPRIPGDDKEFIPL
ncbi:pirin family protein [Pseudoalteromonas arctica]|uniref:Pirin family protein n=1 Tax=Pseudoalteromonas arctica TaxID=394751 RepID=A0A7Y0DS08_9GAMM|nr:pirin family protein [Pseudoalteromonas arctica]NMM40592.1 pirin family protein [Pseudoalteromonas arctica]